MEGIESDRPDLFNKARDDMISALKRFCTLVRPYTHLAIKLTGLGDMDMFINWSKAQEFIAVSLLEGTGKDRIISREHLISKLKSLNLEFEDSEVTEFIQAAT